MNILILLKEDHGQVKELLTKLDETSSRAIKTRILLLRKLKEALLLHEKIEQDIFYPRLASHKEMRIAALEAYEEHHVANIILSEVEKEEPETEIWKAKFSVFKENLLHHIEEEEKELFPKAKQLFSKQQLEEMGEQMLEVKEHLKAGAEM